MQTLDKPQILGDHLTALRGCLLRTLAFLAIGFLLIFFFFASDLIHLVLSPLRSYSFILGRVPDIGNLIVINILDKFVVTLLISMFGAFFLSVPYTFFEFWKFLNPALTSKEKNVFIFFFPFVMFFFVAGALFGYFFVIPVSIDFLANFGNESFAIAGIETSITILSYLRYFFLMTFFLGVIFELPLLLMLIVRVTDLEPRSFARFRRHFVVLSFIIAMFLTPPDVITQLMLALPMIVMYEVGIILTHVAQKRKSRNFEHIQEDKQIDFENTNFKNDESTSTETLQPDVITGFTKIDNKKESSDFVENNSTSNEENFDTITLENNEQSENSDKPESKRKKTKNDLSLYTSDPAISALSEQQIKAVLRLIELHSKQNKKTPDSKGS